MKKISLETMQNFKKEYFETSNLKFNVLNLESESYVDCEKWLTEKGLQYIRTQINLAFNSLFRARKILIQKIIIAELKSLLNFCKNDENLKAVEDFLRRMEKYFD